MTINMNSKVTLAKRALDLVAGTQKHTPNGAFTLGSEAYTTATLVQLLQGLAEAIANVDTTRAAWQDALASADDEQAKAVPVLRAYQSMLLATYGNAPATLADYGLVPHKGPTPPSASVKATAVLKREATRTARHTMGKEFLIRGVEPRTGCVERGTRLLRAGAAASDHEQRAGQRCPHRHRVPPRERSTSRSRSRSNSAAPAGAQEPRQNVNTVLSDAAVKAEGGQT
jgi:hypothetical protein